MTVQVATVEYNKDLGVIGRLPLEKICGPGESAAEGDQHHIIPFFDDARFNCLVKGNGDRSA